MPAEWEPHEATWLSWPHNLETWPTPMMGRMERLWALIAKELSKGEQVHINVLGLSMEKRARSLLQESGANLQNVVFHHFPTNDAWIRDHGPVFIIRNTEGKGQVALTDWEYNSWGNKYPPFDKDNQIPSHIAESLNLEKFVPGMVLEGGAIEVNGKGILLTTESCLLNPNRNPSFSQKEIEERLKGFLGVQDVLWLGEGIVGDDTDGHVDDFARFVDSGTLVYSSENNPADENYLSLQENYQRLLKLRQERRFELVPLPMPGALIYQGERLPASYANFYIGNEVVLVPVFRDPKDPAALEILSDLFPDRRVVGVDSRELVIGLGGVHCVTKQMPNP